MLAIVQTRACVGVSAPAVSVEVHLSGGLPALSIAGYNNPEIFFALNVNLISGL
jgi:hypothetical protein